MPRPHFYMPRHYLPDAEHAEGWKAGSIRELHESGKIAAAQCWIYQTQIRLAAAGIDCPLVHEFPKSGVVVALAGSMPENYSPPQELFVVGVVADYRPNPAAHLHLIQNARHVQWIPRSHYVPLWTQPGLVPRDTRRGDRFERVVFFGDPINMAPELSSPQWAERLRRELNLEFEVRGAARWHDFSDVDCVVGIRSFDQQPHLQKPPTKLFNAWLAGVPFIGGADSAYRAERRSEYDYLEATTLEELLRHLAAMKESPSLRLSLREAAHARAAEVTPEKMCSHWIDIVERVIPEAVEEWKELGPMGWSLRHGMQRVRLGLLQKFNRYVR